MSPNVDNKAVLVTGGTGSLGRSLTQRLLASFPSLSRLVIYSRDEQKQYQMALDYPSGDYPQLEFVIGDVRDQHRLRSALTGINYVVHAAAMKHVHLAELNPSECIKTNVGGAENVIQASLDAGVERVVALSTDKACAPINLYGATKLTSDKLFVAANNLKSETATNLSVVRYGNVLGSAGSVVPLFLKKRLEPFLPITDERMTRFSLTLDKAVDVILHALDSAWGGEIFVPKISSYRTVDVAEAIAPNSERRVIGIRPGEKLHEEMITKSDSFFTYEVDGYYVIVPSMPAWSLNDFISAVNAKLVPPGFSYSSNENTDWETVDSLRHRIRDHIDPSFTYEQ